MKPGAPQQKAMKRRLTGKAELVATRSRGGLKVWGGLPTLENKDYEGLWGRLGSQGLIRKAARQRRHEGVARRVSERHRR